MEEVDSDEKELWGLLEQVLRKACEQFVETRKTEGRTSGLIFCRNLIRCLKSWNGGGAFTADSPGVQAETGR